VSTDSSRPGAARFAVPGLLLTTSIAWMFLVHHGLGPRPEVPTSELRWWSPRGFWSQALIGSSWEWLIDERPKGIAFFGAPSLLLLFGVWATTRSALMRVAALVTTIATFLFLYYALGSGVTQVAWTFFHWRASGTMLAVATVFGCVLGSPWLAASWLRQSWPVRIALLVPVVLLVLAIERNVTGTNDHLPFAISPWPAVQVFAIEAFGTTVAAQLAGVALALVGLRAWRLSKRMVSGVLALIGGVALPALASRAFAALELLPYRVTEQRMVGAALLCALLVAIAAATTRFDAKRLRQRALHFATAAALVGLPLFVGTAWARFDYSRTRDVAAQKVIDALAKYYEKESVYPDSLSQLVEGGYLDALPTVSIGFREPGAAATPFTYQAFGTSYLLEFSAPRWVQCAYNPPYADEDADDEPAADVASNAEDGDAPDPDAELGGAWSCPSKPPELW
jgi:hypothetical protein